MVIGIDLGTTNSAVAYVDENGIPQIIPNREGERTTPSVILFDDGIPVVGTVAKNTAATDPLSVVQFVKRQMGNNQYKFLNEDGEAYTPEELSAIILKRLKEDAEAFLGKPVKQAVITVPAYFDDAQRKATQDAGAIAGLEVLKVINEPTAAALAYGTMKKAESQNIVVYDLGGGTFDVTVMSIQDDNVTIKATGGDRNLGGFDFDNKIIEHVVDKFDEEHGIDLYDDDVAMQELREKAESAKKTLMNRRKALINLSSQGQMLRVQITKEDFENMIHPLLDRTILIMNNVLEDSGLTWDQIDKVLLVGGSTRVPKIHELIEKVSGKKPSSEVNPDEVVAIGAAIQADILQKSTNPSVKEALPKITDVNSHSLGVIIQDSETGQLKNNIILPRNTSIPAEGYEDYYTVQDNQEFINLEITEGEDEDPEYVKIIGTTTLHIKKRAAGSPVRVVVSYDENSVIHIRVIDLIDNEDLGEMEINRTSNLSEEEIEAMSSKISNIEID